MKQSDSSNFPPCQYTRQCLQLLDELVGEGEDEGDANRRSDHVLIASISDWEDDRLVERLRTHLPNCSTCSAALARENTWRTEQRGFLRGYLEESEENVPPVIDRIFSALQEEEHAPEASARRRQAYMLPELFNTQQANQAGEMGKFSRRDYNEYSDHHISAPPAYSPFRRLARNVFALATAAALLFAAFGIFGHFWFRPTGTLGTLAALQTVVAGQSQHSSNAAPVSSVTLTSPVAMNVSPVPTSAATPSSQAFQGWNGVALVTGVGATYHIISTYNYLNGDSRELAKTSSAMQFDGVASSGQNMLYQVTTGGDTLFFTLTKLGNGNAGLFYGLDKNNALNAIWMPDSINALIATMHEGVIEVNTQTGQSQSFLPDLLTSGLKFYRNGYLYFLGGPDRALDTLFRVNMATGMVQQVTTRSMGGDFWLSPDGMTVYYHNNGPAGFPGIYAVSSDGSQMTNIRPDGVPIGYAPDDSLVVMREVNRTFEVVQLGPTTQQDQVLMADVAPGATSLCNPSLAAPAICDTTNIALAPLSHALIVIASYPDGSRKVWSDDLTTGKQFVIMTLSGSSSAMVPGWDTIGVA